MPYSNITPGSIVSQIQSQPGLADAGIGAGWTIRRRSITYTVTATVCTMDDARDGGGTHSAGGFCTDSVAQNTPDSTGATDKSPEDYKRVRVQATWKQGNSTRDVAPDHDHQQPGQRRRPRRADADAQRLRVAPGRHDRLVAELRADHLERRRRACTGCSTAPTRPR